MGLTIHYTLAAPGATTAKAKKLVESLHKVAKTVFKNVGPVLHLRGDACDSDRIADNDRLFWLLLQAGAYVDCAPKKSKRQMSVRVTPIEVIAFNTQPGPGCEDANFGLCRYPKTVQVPYDGVARNVPTNLQAWRWGSFCKTQYASDPSAGGPENFLRCHTGIVKILDAAGELGMLGSVSDESGYWEQRNTEALVREVAGWNEMIAALVGRLKDLTSEGGANVVSAPIFEYPDFEHLEARGAAAIFNEN